MKPEVELFLTKNNIEFILHKHPAVFTCEEAEKHCNNIPGLSCKNLFLKDKKADNYYLVIMPAKKRMDLKNVASRVSSKKITFANEQELQAILKLTKGAVSPFGLINDKETKTKVQIDKELWEADIVSFHPNINTETIELSKEMFHRFIHALKHSYTLISM